MKVLPWILVILLAVIVVLFQQNHILRAERDRQIGNIEALMGEVKRYKMKDSLNVASVSSLNLTVEELKKYQDRMGYTEESMRSMRYKMSVYDDFTEEYDYRVKYNRNHSSEEQLKAQAEQQIITPVRRRGRGR